MLIPVRRRAVHRLNSVSIYSVCGLFLLEQCRIEPNVFFGVYPQVLRTLKRLKASGALKGTLEGPLVSEASFNGSHFLSADVGAPKCRLLLEVDGPSHFVTVLLAAGEGDGPPESLSSEEAAAAGASRNKAARKYVVRQVLNGSSVFKSVALQLLGWRLVRLSHSQWREASDKEALLMQLLGPPATSKFKRNQKL